MTDLSPLAQRLSIAVAVASTALVAMAAGLLAPVFAIQLDGRGHDSATVGIFAATGSLAVMAGASLAPRALARFGTVAILRAALVAIVIATLIYGLTQNLAVWFALRLLMGLGAGAQWVTAETWLIRLARPDRRGRIMAVYVATTTASFAAGPILAGMIGTAGAVPFLAAAALAGVAACVLSVGWRLLPALPVAERTGIFASLRSNPLPMLVAFVGGINDMAMIALAPLYGLHAGYAEGASALLVTAYTVGAVALQFPIGWLADRSSRTVLLWLFLGACATGALLLPMLHGTAVIWPLFALWGGLSFGLYTVALTTLASRLPMAALAGANAAFVAAYQLGSVSGPAISGAAMERFGPQGLPTTLLLIDVACLIVVLVAELRRRNDMRKRRRIAPAPSLEKRNRQA
ncbi:MAG: MFS transporter [Alphaproteobacteria bacterium]